VVGGGSHQCGDAQWAFARRLDFLLDPPGCHLTFTAFPLFSHNTNTLLSWNSEVADNDTMHSNATNPSHVVINTAGLYEVSVNLSFEPNSTGRRVVMVGVNTNGVVPAPGASTFVAQDNRQHANSGSCSVAVGVVEPLAVGDYLQVWAYQDSGASLSLNEAAIVVRWAGD
jgi:hypothetical protein